MTRPLPCDSIVISSCCRSSRRTGMQEREALVAPGAVMAGVVLLLQVGTIAVFVNSGSMGGFLLAGLLEFVTLVLASGLMIVTPNHARVVTFLVVQAESSVDCEGVRNPRGDPGNAPDRCEGVRGDAPDGCEGASAPASQGEALRAGRAVYWLSSATPRGADALRTNATGFSARTTSPGWTTARWSCSPSATSSSSTRSARRLWSPTCSSCSAARAEPSPSSTPARCTSSCMPERERRV